MGKNAKTKEGHFGLLQGLTAGLAGAVAVFEFLLKWFNPYVGWIALLIAAALVVSIIVHKWSAIRADLARLSIVSRWCIAILVFSVATLTASGAIYYELRTFSSTQFVGSFPLNLAELTKLISAADESVHVLVDHVAYGGFSNPAEFERYLAALIEAKKDGADIQIVGYNPRTKLIEDIKNQFGDSLINDDRFKELVQGAKFQRFLEENKGYREPATAKEFEEIVSKHNEKATQRLENKGIDVDYIESDAPVFIWLIDETHAAFSFTSHAPNSNEVMFVTDDANFVAILRAVFQKYAPDE